MTEVLTRKETKTQTWKSHMDTVRRWPSILPRTEALEETRPANPFILEGYMKIDIDNSNVGLSMVPILIKSVLLHTIVI